MYTYKSVRAEERSRRLTLSLVVGRLDYLKEDGLTEPYFLRQLSDPEV